MDGKQASIHIAELSKLKQWIVVVEQPFRGPIDCCRWIMNPHK
jgi:hypothetical protein